jgi:hypothetical protein
LGAGKRAGRQAPNRAEPAPISFRDKSISVPDEPVRTDATAADPDGMRAKER